MIDLLTLSRDELTAMADAGEDIRTCVRVLRKTGHTVISDLLRGEAVTDWRHYPHGDVYDAEYHAQYYYHCHPKDERLPSEYGHFHTFLRPLGMPDGVAPLPLPDQPAPVGDNEALSHLIGIATDDRGQALRLFTTNRWVTGETWYAADDVIRMLDRFVIDHAQPSWPANRWITALIRLYRPHVVRLLRERDGVVRRWADIHADRYVFEDRSLEVPSQMTLSVDDHIVAVAAALRGRRPADGGDG